jgi:hypothetical protein
VDDGVQQRLHALVLEGRTGQDGHDLVGDGAHPDGGADLGHGGLLTVEELHHDVVVHVGEGLEQVAAVLAGLGLECGSDGSVGHREGVPAGSEVLGVPDEGLHGYQVDHTGEVGLGPDGQLQDRHAGIQPVDDGLDAAEEVGTGAVHLVDEADAGDAVAVGLAPHGLGLGLYAGHTVEHGHSAVEDA